MTPRTGKTGRTGRNNENNEKGPKYTENAQKIVFVGIFPRFRAS